MRGANLDKNDGQKAARMFRTGVLPLLMLFSAILPGSAFATDPQFGGYCAEGLTMNKMVKTDCSVNWTSPDGKLYCFSSDNFQGHVPDGSDGEHQKGRSQLSAVSHSLWHSRHGFQGG